MVRKVDPYADAGLKPCNAYSITAVRVRDGVVTQNTIAVVVSDVMPTAAQIVSLGCVNGPKDIARDLERYGFETYVATDRTVLYFLVPNTRSEECRIEIRKVTSSIFQPLNVCAPPFQPADAVLANDFDAVDDGVRYDEPPPSADDCW